MDVRAAYIGVAGLAERVSPPPDIKAPREVISEGKLVLNGRKRRGDELDLYSHWGRGGVGGQRKGNRVVAREGLRKRKTFSKWKWKENRGREVQEKSRGRVEKTAPGFAGKIPENSGNYEVDDASYCCTVVVIIRG